MGVDAIVLWRCYCFMLSIPDEQVLDDGAWAVVGLVVYHADLIAVGAALKNFEYQYLR